MKLRSHFLLLIALSLFAACSTELDRTNPRDIEAPVDLQAKAAITGTVTLEGEEDYSGTEVRLEGPSIQDISTKADGSFSLNRILPGQYKVTVSQRGWEEVTLDNVALGLGAEYTFGGLELMLHQVQVTGTISTPDSSLVQSANTLVELSRTAGPRSAASGAPAFTSLASTSPTYYPQAVSSESFKRLFRYRAAAAADGSFQFNNVAVGKYKVLVTKAGSAPIEQAFTVGADDVSIGMGDIPLRPLTGRLKIVGKLADGTDSEKYTVQDTITLALDGFNASKMKLGDLVNNVCTYGNEEAYTATRQYTLPAGDGVKTVCVRYINEAGEETDDITGQIILDQTPPELNFVRLNGGVAAASEKTIVLEAVGIDRTSGLARIRWIRNSQSLTSFDFSPSWSDTVLNDDSYTYTVRLEDAAGNVSASKAATVVIDSAPPVIALFLVNGGNTQAIGGAVTLHVQATDQTAMQMKLWVDNESAASYAPFVTQTSVLLPSVDGTHTVGIKLRDIAGNESAPQTFPLNVDGNPPAIGTLKIDAGAAYATSFTVSADMTYAFDAREVQIGESAALALEPWQPVSGLAGSVSKTFTSGEGVRTLYARWRDAAGNETPIVSDSIMIDTTPPSGVSVRIDNNANYNTDTAGQFNLAINGIDMNGVTQMKVMSTSAVSCVGVGSFANDPYNASIVHVYANAGTGVEDTARVCVMVSDTAGNWSDAVSDTIHYDTKAPTVGMPAITLAGGAAVTSESVVTATVLATGSAGMQLSTDSGFAGSSWVPYTTSTNILLTSGDGTKTVYVRFRDLAGNTTLGSNGTVDLDRTAPSGISLTGPTAFNSYVVNLNLSAADPHGPIEVRVSEDPAFGGASWRVLAAARPFTTSSSDGLHTIYGQYRDGAGNLSQILQYTVSIDTAAPTNEMLSIQQGAYTQTQSITVVMGADGANEVELSENPGFGGAVWQPISLTRTFTLSATETTHTVYARYRDLAGNPSGATSASVILDSTNPNPPSVSINGGAAGTNDRQVRVQLGYDPDVVEMQLSESSGFAGSGWLSVTSDALYTLTAGDGPKTIFARVRDASGRISSNGNDNITLDETPPLTPGVTLDGGNSTTNSPVISLLLGNQSGATQMIVGDDPGFGGKSWEAVASNKSYTLPAGDGVKVVYVQYRDSVSNTSGVGSASIVLDTGAPSAAQVVVNSNAQYSTSKNLTLTLFSSGAVTMRVAEDSNFSGSGWVSYASSYAYTITTAGEGTKTVYVEFADAAANVAGPVTDSLVYDGTAPSAGSGVSIDNGTIYTASSQVSVTLGVPADATQIIVADNTGFAGASWQSVTSTISWNIGTGDGTKTVYAKWRDAAGNETAVQSDTIILDTTAPSPNSPAITIAGNARYSTSTTILAVHLDASGADSMIVSEDQGLSSPLYSGSYLSNINVPSPATDGTHTLYVQFSDLAGNASSVRSDSIILDRTIPTLGDAVFNSANRYTQTGDVQVQLFGYDDNPLKWVQLSEDNFVTVDQRPYTPSLMYSLLAGQNVDTTVKVRIVDAAGNASAALTSQTLTFDMTPPTPGTPQILLNGGDMWGTNALLTIVLNPGDSNEFQLGNNPGFAGSQWQPVTNEAIWNLPAGDGYKEVWIRYRDAAGNDTIPASAWITLDTQAPTNVQVLTGMNGLYSNTRSISVDLRATGAYSFAISTDIGFANPVTGDMTWGTTTATLRLPSADGFETVYGIFYDEAGNQSSLAQDSIILDTTPPELYDLAINNYADYANDRWLNLRVDAWDANPITYALMDTTATFNGSATAEDVYNSNLEYYNPVTGQLSTVYVQLIDSAGNASVVTSASIFVDVTAPTGTLIVDTPALSNSRAMSFYFANASGDAVEYQVNEDGWPSPNGWKTWTGYESYSLKDIQGSRPVYFWLRDWAKNISKPYTFTVTYDTDAPIATSFSIAENSVTSNTLWKLNFNSTGADYIEIATDPGFIDNSVFAVTATTDVDVSIYPERLLTLYARYCDNAGNCSNVLQDSATYDITPPQDVAITLPDAPYYNNAIVNIQISAPDAAEMKISSSCSVGIWEPFATAASKDVGTQGPKDIRFKFRDIAGNVSSCYHGYITIDTNSPDMTLQLDGIEGVVGKTANQVVTATISVTDDVSLPANIQMMLSNEPGFFGGVWQPVTKTTNWTIAPGDGIKTVYLKIRDQAGNERIRSKTIALDQTPPANPGLVINAGAVTNNLWADVSVNADGPPVMMRVGRNLATAKWIPYATSATVALGTSNKLKTVYVAFRDDLSNTSIASANVLLDTVAPVPSVVQILDGSYINSESVTIGLGIDNPSGITMVVSNDIVYNEAPQSFAPTLTHLLATGDGPKTVHVRFFDQAGNWADLSSNTVTLDTVPPTTPQIRTKGRSTTATSIVVELFPDSVTDLNFGSFEAVGGADYPAGFTTVSYAIGQTQFTFNLNANQENVLQLRAADLAGNRSSAAMVVVGSDSHAPATITSLTIRSNRNSILLNWDLPVEQDVAGYWVYYGNTTRFSYSGSTNGYFGRAAAQGDSPVWVQGRASTTFSLSNLPSNSTIYAAVVAVDNAGNKGELSNEVFGYVADIAPIASWPNLQSGNTSFLPSAANGVEMTRFGRALYVFHNDKLSIYNVSGSYAGNPYRVTTRTNSQPGGKFFLATAGNVLGKARLYAFDGTPSTSMSGMSPGITVYDIANDLAPIEVTRVSLAGDEMPYSVTMVGDKLFALRLNIGNIFGGPHKLDVYDLSNPDLPMLSPTASTVFTGTLPFGVAVNAAGTKLVIPVIFTGYSLYDITAGGLVKTGSVSSFGGDTLQIAGDYLFVPNSRNIDVYSLAGTSPVLSYSITMTDDIVDQLRLDPSRKYLYTVGPDGTAVLDVQNPAAATIRKIYLDPYASFDSEEYTSVVGNGGDYSYAANAFKFDTINLTGTPLIDDSDSIATQYYDMDIMDGLVAVAEGQKGVAVYSLDTGVPVLLSRKTYGTCDFSRVKWVKIKGYRMIYAICRRYIAGISMYSGLISVNANNPYNMSMLGEYWFNNARFGDLAISDQGVEVTINYADGTKAMRTMTTTTPDNLGSGIYCSDSQLSSLRWPLTKMVFRDGHIFVQDGNSRISSLDMSLGCSARYISSVGTQSYKRLVQDGTDIYGIGQYGYLNKLDVSDPANMTVTYSKLLPKIATSTFGNDSLGGLAVAGSFIYALGNNGVYLYDDTGNTPQIVSLGHNKFGSTIYNDPTNVEVDGNQIVALDGKLGLQIWQAFYPSGFRPDAAAAAVGSYVSFALFRHSYAAINSNSGIEVYHLQGVTDMVLAGSDTTVNPWKMYDAQIPGFPMAGIVKSNYNTLWLLDYSNPGNPLYRSVLTVATTNMSAIEAVEGNRIYYTTATDEVAIISASAPLTEVGSRLNTTWKVLQILPAGNLVILTLDTVADLGYTKAMIYNITGDSWVYNSEFALKEYISSPLVYGTRLYIVDTNSPLLLKLEVYSLSNPLKNLGSPVLLGSQIVKTSGSLFASGNYVFTSYPSWYDFADPAAPLLLFSSPGEYFGAVHVVGPYGYTFGGGAGFQRYRLD